MGLRDSSLCRIQWKKEIYSLITARGLEGWEADMTTLQSTYTVQAKSQPKAGLWVYGVSASVSLLHSQRRIS